MVKAGLCGLSASMEESGLGLLRHVALEGLGFMRV